MDEYTIYCTPEQTKRALELGAPILPTSFDDNGRHQIFDKGNLCYYNYPTAEQMRGWLMHKLKATTFANKHYSCCDKEGFGFLIIGAKCVLECDASDNGKWLLCSDKEAALAAIDAALEHLENSKIKR